VRLRLHTFLILGILISFFPAGAWAETLLARQGVDQLLRLNFEKAEAKFTQLKKQDPDYALLGFLGASVYWVKAEASQGEARSAAWQEAERRLEHAIALAETALEQKPGDPLWRLNLGMSQFFLGRVQIELQHLFKAIRYARAGRDTLRVLIQTHPEMEDAYFVLGMYEYVAGSVPRALKWLTYLLDISGDRALGVQYLERATARARVMAPEAARMLLGAAGIQPEHVEPCRYLRLARQMIKLYPENPHYSGAAQLILAHCGYPEEALAENKRAFDTFLKRFPDMTGALNLIKLQIYPAMGAMAEIDKMKPLYAKRDYSHWYLAKAQAYDVLGKRKQAMSMYRDLEFAVENPEDDTLFNDTPPDYIYDKAILYLKQPYHKPKAVRVDSYPVLVLNNPRAALKPINTKSPLGW
jgi:tetratricopeptide (TPR) repeat protein